MIFEAKKRTEYEVESGLSHRMVVKIEGKWVSLDDLEVYVPEKFNLEPISKHEFVTALIDDEQLYLTYGNPSTIKVSAIDGSATINEAGVDFKLNNYFTESQLKDEGLINEDGELLEGITLCS